ncbi:MAG TPA: hypothetical protein VNQ32_13805 [Steroidobacteraceae bacterium]|nr:hypothetical protein [Steroidobacteraceae bacterium]
MRKIANSMATMATFLLWISLTVLVVALASTLWHFPDARESSSAAEDSSSSLADRPPEGAVRDSGPSPIEVAQVLSSEADVAPPSPAPFQPTSVVHDGPAALAASYAKSLQTGVFGAEPMPEFAERYLFPTEAARQAASASQEEFLGSPIDHWSGLMEERLRTAFGSHPFMANARVSIMCRSTRCKLQFVEPTVRGQPEGELGPNSLMMMIRVAKEPWFGENFSEWKTQAATPASASAAYQLVVLPRRFSQP